MDLEMAQELQGSLLWKGVVGELDRKIAFEVSKLKTCGVEEVLITQAKIKCFEELTRLPADVIDRQS